MKILILAGSKAMDYFDNLRYHYRVYFQSAQIYWSKENITPFTLGMFLYLSLLPDEIQLELCSFMRKHRIDLIIMSEINKMSSAISSIAKILRGKFSKYWRYYIDWATLSGYQGFTDDELAHEGISWINWPTSHKSFDRLSPSDIVIQGLIRFTKKSGVLKNNKKFKNFLRPSQIINNPSLWIRQGSVFSKHNEEIVPKGLSRNKAGAAVGVTSDFVARALTGSGSNVCRIFPKRDKGKKRVVAGSALEDIILETPLVESFMNAFDGVLFSTLFQDYDIRLKTQIDILWELREQKHWYFPIDQEKFDWHFKLETIRSIIDYCQTILGG